MTTPASASSPQTFRDYADRRYALQDIQERIQDTFEQMDEFALALLERYDQEFAARYGRVKRHAAPSHVPCGFKGTGWAVTHVTSEGIEFGHDCRDHGYDLADYERFVLPLAYCANPDTWWDSQDSTRPITLG